MNEIPHMEKIRVMLEEKVTRARLLLCREGELAERNRGSGLLHARCVGGRPAPLEERMQLRDHCGALPDSRPDPLHRAATDVADSKDAFDPRLQGLRYSSRRGRVGAGPDEALLVERNA